MMPTIKLQKVHPNAIEPKKATSGSACFDLFALKDVEIKPGEMVRVGTGFHIEVPPDHALMIYSRSGQGFNNRVTLVNGTGVIDSDYRGHVMVGLQNNGTETYFQPYGKAIAQAMLVYVPFTTLEITEELSETERGEGGFGHTDNKHCGKPIDGVQCERAKYHEGPCAASLGGTPIMGSRHLEK